MFPDLGLPGIGEFWLSPQVLVKADGVATDELSVTRMDQDFAGRLTATVQQQQVGLATVVSRLQLDASN